MLGREICWDEMVQAQHDFVRASFERISELSRRYVEIGQAVAAATLGTAADEPLATEDDCPCVHGTRTRRRRRAHGACGRALRPPSRDHQPFVRRRLHHEGLAEEVLGQLKRALEVIRGSRRLILFDIVE